MSQTEPTESPKPSAIATACGGVERLCLGLAKPLRWAVRGWLPYGYHLVE